MSALFKVIAIIVIIWFTSHIKKIISGIKIISSKSPQNKRTTSKKYGMNIQDADYEEVE